MKKVLTIAIAIMTVATLISCGASSRAQSGLTKASTQGQDQFSSLTGVKTDSMYIYSTAEFTCNAQLTAANINLAGLFGTNVTSRTVTDFSMSLFIDSTYKQSFIYMVFEFADEVGTPYLYDLISTSPVVINGTSMTIYFTDGTQIVLTTLPGSTTNVINVVIQDSGVSVPFANGTPFTLTQTPAVATK
ncbi:MAG: hypothetical protein NTY22_01955 [Proteobacteria bacterium]|nr:hypothetical protein [Pseudomonadota bacterium]